MTMGVTCTGLKLAGGLVGGGVAGVVVYPQVFVGSGALVLGVAGMVLAGVVVQTRLWEEAFILRLYPLLWLVVAVKVV